MGARILLIDDCPDSLELMRCLLDAAGHVAIDAQDGAEGLALAEAAPPDLILCDLHLPDLDGFQIAGRLKADPALRAIPLVALTASALAGDREKVLAGGFDRYLSKPVAPERVVAEIDRYLPPGRRSVPPVGGA